MKSNRVLTISVLLIIALGCNNNKSSQKLENGVSQFLDQFSRNLSYDDITWSLFQTGQSREEVFKALYILQNRDSIVRTTVSFEKATSSWKDRHVVVAIPVELSAGEEKKEGQFELFLSRKDGHFHINRIGAEELYKEFYIMRSQIANAAKLAEELKYLSTYVNLARKIQGNYDSMAWFVKHNNNIYFYTVNCDTIAGKHKCLMGLVDATGKLLVPANFDLIGTPSIVLSECVEVKKDNKVGYYQMDGTLLIPAEYDWLVPFADGSTFALVMKDSVNGWLDTKYSFHAGFPSERARRAIVDLQYLVENKLSLGDGYVDMILPLWDFESHTPGSYMVGGYGKIVPPTYYVKMGLFEEEESNYTTGYGKSQWQVGTASITNSNHEPTPLTESISAFISDFASNVNGSRSNFYISNRIALLDKKAKVLNAVKFLGGKDLKIRRTSNDLIEAAYLYVDYEPEWDLEEQNIPIYKYFLLKNNNLIELQSRRRFSFTQFIELDSTYLSGDFIRNNPAFVIGKKTDSTRSSFLSAGTINYMREEIMADYGYKFADSVDYSQPYYKHWKSQLPPTTSYDEIYSRASDIEKHNLDFISRLTGPFRLPQPAQ